MNNFYNKKMSGKRILAGFLAGIMVLSSSSQIFSVPTYIRAEEGEPQTESYVESTEYETEIITEDDGTEIQPDTVEETATGEPLTVSYDEEVEEPYILYMNGKDTSKVIVNGQYWNNAVTIEYGKPISFEVKQGEETDEILGVYYTKAIKYKNNNPNDDIDTSNFVEFTSSTNIDVGNYYLFFESDKGASMGVKPEAVEGEEEKLATFEFVMRVTESELVAPVLAGTDGWDETKVGKAYATWNPVTKDHNDLDITAGTNISYVIKLYFEDETEPFYTSSAITTTGYDLTSVITSATGKGYGKYTYVVEASETGKSVNNYAAAQSSVSGEYIYKDEVDPEISSYDIKTEGETRYLTGTATDAGTGIAAYAFAPASIDTDDISWIEVTGDNKGTDVEIEEELDDIDAGHIYLYVKDGHGNIAHKDITDGGDDIYITDIDARNYYLANSKTEYDKKLLNDETLTLPESRDMARTGYSFAGWYTASDYSGEKVTTLVPGVAGISKGSKIVIYGKWNKQELSFSKQPENISKKYNSVASTITATLDSSTSYDSISWQWYYAPSVADTPVAIDGATATDTLTTSYSVKDVADSGRYYAVATISVDGEDDVTATSSTSVVNIEKRTLEILIDDAAIGYMQTAPAFGFGLGDNSGSDKGLVGEDTLDTLLSAYVEKLVTDYTPGDDIGDYEIRYDGSASEITADNYDITLLSNGTLSVNAMNLTDVEGVVVSVEENDYYYDGTAKTPAVTGVTLSGNSLRLGDDYTVGYQNNIQAEKSDTAVVITFTGNYTGTKTVPFAIKKGGKQVSVAITGWKYGERTSDNNPSISDTTGGTVTFYYLKTSDITSTDDELVAGFGSVDKTARTSVIPVDAGRYYVWAEIAATDNYETVVSSPAVFTIQKRKIVLSSNSVTWPYDANAHSDSSYTQTGDGFVGEDGFQSVSVTGTITDIGSIENAITYKLTKATKADNYDIEVKNGTLVISETKLVAPSSFNWDNSNPGSLRWIAITKDNLNVQYKLNLYRKESDGTFTYITSKTTASTSESFIDEILADSATTQYGYSATIQVEPVYAENEAHNYVESDESVKIATKYTAKVSILPEGTVDGVGVEDTYIGNKDEHKTEVVIFQGQSITTGFITKNGFVDKHNEQWGYSNNPDGTYLTAYPGTSDPFYDEEGLHYEYSAKHSFTNAAISGPQQIVVYAKASDSFPVIDRYHATQVSDYSKVKIELTVSDRIGLKEYALIKGTKEDVAPGHNASTEWTTIPADSDSNPRKTYSDTVDITEPGIYFLYVRDTSNNCTYRVTPIVVYEINFDGGESTVSNPVSGSMPSLYKLKDETVTLPVNAFERPGYGFTNWTGNGVIYSDGGLFVANSSVTLVAGWTDRKVHYKVRYFYQKLTETDDAETGKKVISLSYEEKTPVEYTGEYGKHINYDDAAYQAGKTGYVLTSTPVDVADYNSTVTLTTDDTELCIYYDLEKYKIRYQYTGVDGNPADPIEHDYYYGQTIYEEDTPSEVGYSFVGWNWGEAGHIPETMPNNNLTATGYFQADQTQYYIVYYEQTLDQRAEKASENYLGKSFAKDEAMTEVINANYADSIRASIEAMPATPGVTDVVARQITGFTPVAAKIYYGSERTTATDEEFADMISGIPANKSATGTVSKYLEGDELEAAGEGYKNGPTYICFYYTRNIYDITLDVYKDHREAGVNLFGSFYPTDNAKWTFPYGFVFAGEDEEIAGDGTDGKYKASYFETFGYDRDGFVPANNKLYSKAWTNRWPVDTTSYSKYYLADFVDWSTGSRPETMPAGDAAITREYASAEQSKYVIDVYVEELEKVPVSVALDGENSVDVITLQATGKYSETPAITFDYYDLSGLNIEIVDEVPDVKAPDTKYILVKDLAAGVNLPDQYEHNPANDLASDEDQEILSGVIKENKRDNNILDPDSVTHLRLNLVRKEYTSYIRYYKRVINDKGDGNKDNLFAYTKVKQKWGTTFFVDPLCYFDGATTAPTYSGLSATKTATVYDASQILDFRDNSYMVSYSAYRYVQASDTHTNPSGKYDSVTAAIKGNTNSIGDYIYQYNINNHAVQMWIMGGTKDGTDKYAAWEGNKNTTIYDYVNIYYSPQKLDEHYLLRMRYEDSSDNGTYHPLTPSVNSVMRYSDGTEVTDITDYEIYVANKADIYKSELNMGSIPTEWQKYKGGYYAFVASQGTGGNYNYEIDPVTGEEVLRDGFKKVTVTYGNADGSVVEHDDAYTNSKVVVDTVREGTFYVYGDQKILYVADSRNQFYNGNRAAVSYHGDKDFLSKDNANVGRDVFARQKPTIRNTVYERDNTTTQLIQYGKADTIASGNLPVIDATAYYWDTYDVYYYLTFRYNSINCTTCSTHNNFKKGDVVTEFKCSHFSAPEGYHIEWFIDSECKIPAEELTINDQNTVIYGRLIKNPIENLDYAFYKLPETYADLPVEWVTDVNVGDYTWEDRTVLYDSGKPKSVDNIKNAQSLAAVNGNGFEMVTTVVDVPYQGKTIKGLKSEWLYNGILVMSSTSNYSETYSEFHMDYTRYAKDGFVYDETNVKNKSKAFCTTTPVSMYAYYTRTTSTLTVTRNNSKNDNDEVSTQTNGAKITLEDPKKVGYVFSGWQLQKVSQSDEGEIVYTNLNNSDYRYSHTEPVVDADGNEITPGSSSFLMPICDTRALAIWEPDVVDFSIVHMLQDENKTYNMTLLSAARDIMNGGAGRRDAITIYRDGAESGVSATACYDAGDKLVAVVYKSGNKTYYYDAMQAGNKVELSELFAVITDVVDAKSEDELKISDHIISELGIMYEYSFTTYTRDATKLKLTEKVPEDAPTGAGEDQTFEVYLDAEVIYYYLRSSSISIRTLAVATDSSTSGLTLSGAGDRYYGEKVTLYSSMQPKGYTFLGWFNAADVLEGYPTDGSCPESLSGFELKSDIADQIDSGAITPVESEANYSFVAKRSADYVAITSAGEAAKPVIEVKSNRILTAEEATLAGKGPEAVNPYYYGYAGEASNSLTATVTWGDGGVGANSIKKYTWYYQYYENDEDVPADIEKIDLSEMTEIADSNSGTYLFPTGKDAGSYVYRCVVDIKREDNNRTSVVYGSYKLIVNPKEDYYETAQTEYVYACSKQPDKADTHTYAEYYHYVGGIPEGITYYYSESPISASISDSELATRLAAADGDADKIYTENIEYSEVLVDMADPDKAVIPHMVYYLAKSENKNYATVAGSEGVKITPAAVTVTALKPFTKYYDASVSVNGKAHDDPSTPEDESKRYIDNVLTDSDFRRLQLGTDLNGGMYYSISGILNCDKNLHVVLDFDAEYDNMHVIGATSLRLTNLWVAVDDLYEVTDNYNYRFTTQTYLDLSGQIKPYPLDITWIPNEGDSVDVEYTDDDYAYNYDGTEKHPFIEITDKHTPDPKSVFNLVVGNAQKNVDTYYATAEIKPSDNGGTYAPSDYTFTLTTRKYSILPRFIKVTPKDVTKVYNGQDQTMVKNASVDEFRFYTKEKESDPWVLYTTLPTGETFSVSSTASGKNVGKYTIGATGIRILNGAGKNINDDYHIEYGTGELTIVPCPVIVEGITASDKNYDGNTNATVNVNSVTFARLSTDDDCNIIKVDGNVITTAGLYGSDVLNLDSTKVSGVFTPDAKAGNDKNVNITIDNSSAAPNGSGGALIGVSSSNYRLVTDESQKTTTASILKGTVLNVGISNLEITYGESLTYSDYALTYTGFASGETADTSVSKDASHKATYIIKKKNGATYDTVLADGTAAGVSTLDVGTYYIFPKLKEGGSVNEVDGLYSENYSIIWDAKPATLTVKKRPVGISAVADAPAIQKDYDGTTDVAADVIKTTEAGTFKYYSFVSVSGETESGRVNDDDIYIDSYQAVYDSSNVTTAESGAKNVKVTAIVLGGTKASNYELKNNAIDVNGEITPIALTITVDNKETIYGNAAPEPTFTIEGCLEEEETAVAAAVKATTKVNCDYTAAKGNANRNAGIYELTVDSEDRYSNDNYSITFRDGNDDDADYGHLTVKKRIVYYSATDKTINYGMENPPEAFAGAFTDDATDNDDYWVYDELISTTPQAIKYIGSEVEFYSDEACLSQITSDYTTTFTCYETGTTPISNKTPAGEYTITPANVEKTIYTKNYEFKNKSGAFTVAKFYMVVKNVEVLGKIYDGTTDVDSEHLVITPDTYTYIDGGVSKLNDGLVFDYYEGEVHIENQSIRDLITSHGQEYVDELLASLKIDASYRSAQVSDEATVDVDISLVEGSYIDKRYVLLTESNKAQAIIDGGSRYTDSSEVTQTETTAFIIGPSGEKILKAIEPRPLTLYPKDASIKYGTVLTVTTDKTKTGSNYSIIEDRKPAADATGTDKEIGFVAGEGFTNISFSKSDSIYEATTFDENHRPTNTTGAAYVSGSDVGEYVIDISSSTPVGVAGNYVVDYEPGLLTVVQNSLAAPTVTWDSTNIGTIKWTAVAKIGKVNVDHYVAELYKDGSLVDTYVSADNTELSHDFSSKMHESAGKYMVKVHAVASTTDNEAYKNVAENGAIGSSADKYAARVVVKFDTTANSDTEKATTSVPDTSKQINNSGSDSYVMIAGESGIAIDYTWGRVGDDLAVYKSGYAIDKITSSNVSNLKFGTATDNSGEGSYSNTVSLVASHSAKDDINVTLYLKARPATLNLSITEKTNKNRVMYAYSAEERPQYTAVTSHSDEVTSEYTYTYEWSVYKNSKTTYDASNGNGNPANDGLKWNEKIYDLMYGLTVYNNAYRVNCKVVAVRKDNGQKITVSEYKALSVIPAQLSQSAVTINVANWTYGDVRDDISGKYKISATPILEGIGDITLKYSKVNDLTDDSLWSTTKPTDAGTWYVRADVAASENYGSIIINPKSFTISQAKLGTPTVTMTASSRAPYGLVKWDSISGPVENNGTGDSKSHIEVEYEVTLSVDPSDGSPRKVVKKVTVENSASPEYDFTDYIQEDGQYFVEIHAKVKSKTESFAGQDKNNCADGDITSIQVLITIGAQIETNGTATAKGFTREYDGTPFRLTAVYSDISGYEPEYQWMKNGAIIPGATNKNYEITYVEDTASYSCAILPHGKVADSDKIYTKTVLAQVTPKTITLTTSSGTWVYDATEHRKNSVAAGALDYSVTLCANDSVSAISFTNGITNVGSVKNNISGLTIIKTDDSNKVVYSQSATTNNNYVVNVVAGDLKVTKRPITVSANSIDVTYDGNSHSDPGFTYSTKTAENPDEGLLDVHKITATVTGSITDAGSVANVISDIKILNKADDVSVASNYEITPKNGVLKVNAAPATITINNAALMSKTYDKVAVSDPVAASAPAPVDKTTYVKTGDGAVTITYYDKDKNPISGRPVNAGTYYVKASTAATNNYQAAESAYESFTIASRPITITANNKTSIYGANIAALTYDVRLTTGDGVAIIDDADRTSLSITPVTTATNTSGVGLYPIEITYTANNNYAVSLEHHLSSETPVAGDTYGKYEITKATMTVTATASDVVYDGNEYGITVTAVATTANTSDTPTVYYSATELNAGNYTSGTAQSPKYSDVKLTDGVVDSYKIFYYVVCDNYEPKSGYKTFKITKRPVTLTADSRTDFVYDGNAHTWEDTLTNPVTHYSVNEYTASSGVAQTDEIDSVDISGSITDVGEVPSVISNAVFKNKTTKAVVTNNYNITYVNGRLVVNKASDTITNVEDLSKEYDGTAVGVPSFDHDLKNTGTVTYHYYAKVGAAYEELENAPKKAGDWYVRIEIDGDSNYTKTVSEYVHFTISRKPVTITSDDDTKVYDGKPLTKWSCVPVGLVTGDAISAIQYTGTITNVKYNGSDVTYADNTFTNVVIKDASGLGEDVTSCYEITPVYGKLTVTQKDIETLELLPNDAGVTVLTYTGSQVALSGVNVYATLGSDTDPTKLTANRDYSITNDPSAKKQVAATEVGTYTVEVTGKGNYKGILTKTYTIVDKDKPVITGKNVQVRTGEQPAVNGGKYCGGVSITIADPNLVHVKITIAGGDATDSVDEDVTSTTKTYTLAGSTTDTPSVYTIVATDISGNVNETYVVSVWAEHNFCAYSQDLSISSTGEVYKAECEHEGYKCGAYKHIIRPKGTVHWDYEYDYPTDTGVHHGIVDRSQRETHARVELMYDYKVIATKIIDCVSQCKDPGSATSAEISYSFDNYDKTDATKDSGSFDLPFIDEDGTEYLDYEIKVTPVKLEEDGSYTEFNTYFVTHQQQFMIEGDKANINYTPNCFDVPWRVELKGFPSVDGKPVTPSAIFVKVLYAEKEDATDAEYYPITQLAGSFLNGVKCHVAETLDDGTVVFTGSYPCWQFIGGSKKSYYHRIQIVGYELDHKLYDTTDKKIKSICDDDHVNHTICYLPEPEDKASGTILFQLSNLMPTLVLDSNITGNGDEIFSTLWAGINDQGEGGVVTYSEITKAGVPVRKGYKFNGWYLERTGGKPIRGDVDLKDGNVVLYAHWSKIEKEEDDDDGPSADPTDTPNSTPVVPGKPTVTPALPDNPQTTPVVPVKPGNPAVTPVAPTAPDDKSVTPTPTPSKGPDDNTGKLEIIVETGEDNNPPVGTTPSVTKPDDQIVGDLPNKDDVADKVLTEEELQIIEDGGEVIIRLRIEDGDKDHKTDLPLEELIKKIKDKNPDKPNVKFERYVELSLEKKINDGDWEQIIKSGGKIEVMIEIPDNLRGKDVSIAMLVDGEYVVLDDLDGDPNTITFMTDDFDTDYVLISIGENSIPLLGFIDPKCFWHWIILLMLILSGVTAIIWWKKEDEEEGKDETVADTSGDDKPRKIRRRGHYILVIVFNGIGAICVILGSCYLDIIVEIISIILTAIIEIIKGYRNRDNKDKNEKIEG